MAYAVITVQGEKYRIDNSSLWGFCGDRFGSTQLAIDSDHMISANQKGQDLEDEVWINAYLCCYPSIIWGWTE